MADGSWTVMTKNLYLGADIAAPLRATSGLDGEVAVEALMTATGVILAELQGTDFGVRAGLLAAEIAAAGPDLVGLQEVALWRRGAVDLEHLGRPDAEVVLWDFLDLLCRGLHDAGAPYDVIATYIGADVEAPAINVADLAGEPFDLRLTMRDVVLVRSDRGIRVVGSGTAGFDTRLTAEVAGLEITFSHGYAWVDVEPADGSADGVRFVTTHLDSESSAVALAQAGEVATAALASRGRPVILVGDLNSDPADLGVRGGDGVPGRAAYRWLVEDAGFVDAAAAAGAPSPTWGFGPDLRDATTDGLTQRIDVVLVDERSGLSVDACWTTGTDGADRDPETGLRPSDHAGVVARLRISPSEPGVLR